MCDVLDRVENRGIEKGIEKGLEEGYDKAQREAVVRMLRLGKFSREDIAAALGLTVDAVERIEQQEMSLT
ncbi:MAG: transposase [Bhargavaea sp.]